MIRSTELRLNLYKIELGVYKAKPKEIKVKEFVKDFLPKGSVLNYFAPMWLKIKEHILLTFFLSVVADNMRSHGVAPFLVDIVYHKGTLRLMFTNHVPKAGAPREHDSLNYHSTGFGLNDIQRISTLRSVDLFLAVASPDGNTWKSELTIGAELLEASGDPTGGAKPCILALDDPIVIMDDMKVIVQLLQRRFEQAGFTNIISLHVCSQSGWDTAVERLQDQAVVLAILDQHLEEKSGLWRGRGTNLIPYLREACVVMHSGNNTEEDQEVYQCAGAHGIFGKGNRKNCVCLVREIFANYKIGGEFMAL